MIKLEKEQYKTRSNSVIDNGELEEISNIENFPVFIGSTMEDISSDIFHNLTFDICKESGMIQLRDVIDSNIIYSKFHSEAIGKVWSEHHDKLSDIIVKYSDNKTILEIGGSDSRLAFKSLDKNINIKKWLIVDPNLKSQINHKKLTYIEEFFNEDIEEYFDMIVHSHTLEHMTDPKTFLESISKKMKNGNYHIFSVPNLFLYMKNKYSNVLNFEHTLFLTEDIIDYLLNMYDFKIEDKIYYSDHSIFYITKKVENLVKVSKVNFYLNYKKMYKDLIDYYRNFVDEINFKIKNTESDIYLFGGHIFSQYLISLGLDTKNILNIIDNSEIKDGQRLYGTNLIIKMPKNLNFKDNSIVILKAGQYQDEIKKQLLDINNKIIFYE